MAAKRTDVNRSRETYEELYVRRHLSVRGVGREIGLSAAAVRKDLRRHGIERRPPGLEKSVALDRRTAQTYQRLYLDEQKSIRGVAAELGVSTDIVMKDMRRLGVPTRPVAPDYAAREALGVMGKEGSDPSPRSRLATDRATSRSVEHRDIGTSFFASIDSDIKAYALGLIWTDGSVQASPPMVRITLQEQDAAALEMIRLAMRAAPLQWQPPQPASKAKSATVTLRVCSREIVSQLQRLGLCESKSARLPMAVPPPLEFERAFVRGAMDGDGSLYRPEYPTIAFYNQNASLRAIVIACWERITGKRPPTYAPITDGVPRPRVCEIGERARAIAHALYLERPEANAIVRKRERAEAFQSWRRALG